MQLAAAMRTRLFLLLLAACSSADELSELEQQAGNGGTLVVYGINSSTPITSSPMLPI